MRTTSSAEGELASTRARTPARTVPVIAGLIARARAAGARVVFTQDTHEAGDPEWAIWPEHARAGTWGHEIVAPLEPADGDTVIRKVRYDDVGTGRISIAGCACGGVETIVSAGRWRTLRALHGRSAALSWYDVVVAAGDAELLGSDAGVSFASAPRPGTRPDAAR